MSTNVCNTSPRIGAVKRRRAQTRKYGSYNNQQSEAPGARKRAFLQTLFDNTTKQRQDTERQQAKKELKQPAAQRSKFGKIMGRMLSVFRGGAFSRKG